MRAAIVTLALVSAMVWIAVREITTRNMAIRLGFEISRLESAHRELLDERQKLYIIREALVSPSRLTPIAEAAGLRAPSPDAVVLIPLAPQAPSKPRPSEPQHEQSPPR